MHFSRNFYKILLSPFELYFLNIFSHQYLTDWLHVFLSSLINWFINNVLINVLQVGCKILSFLKIYFKCCTYTWMFCEGFYLHRLMSNAFSPPRSLKVMYVFGWAAPLLSSTLYGILRGILNNERYSNPTVYTMLMICDAVLAGT